MVFWLGLVITAVGFFSRFTPTVRWIQRRWPAVNERLVHALSLLLFLAGLIVTVIGFYQSQKEKAQIHDELSLIRHGIRYIEADVKVNLSGKWSDGKGPNNGIMTMPSPGIDVVKLLFPNSSEPADLNETGTVYYNRRANGTIDVSYKAETLPSRRTYGVRLRH